ncbi:hypothetical protein ASPCADRAFT_129195 [Aspergillus carbonarius ITEM 5010]|uniref:Uncharacterized protein n=1 Tax=Aspergillus carbonarius (strain ITEM 5010) TaxID=602072 RepID=A0A1R3RSR0_ASPC5|nr:hypothetical protein ASPCADRAFT_129195 [Aspergillus carbonarius ITEM 5010]
MAEWDEGDDGRVIDVTQLYGLPRDAPGLVRTRFPRRRIQTALASGIQASPRAWGSPGLLVLVRDRGLAALPLASWSTGLVSVVCVSKNLVVFARLLIGRDLLCVQRRQDAAGSLSQQINWRHISTPKV